MSTSYVALLRAVNVAGKTLKMADLREVVRSMGYADVSRPTTPSSDSGESHPSSMSRSWPMRRKLTPRNSSSSPTAGPKSCYSPAERYTSSTRTAMDARS